MFTPAKAGQAAFDIFSLLHSYTFFARQHCNFAFFKTWCCRPLNE